MIDLPNDCGLIATAACAGLEKYDVQCRPIRFTWKEDGETVNHAVTIFNCGGRLHAYDRNGTVSLFKSLRMTSRPIAIGKSWGRERCQKVIRAEWWT